MLKRIFFEIYFFIYAFEKFFSQKPKLLIKNLKIKKIKKSLFYLIYIKALKLKFHFPKAAKKKFLNLLNMKTDIHFDHDDEHKQFEIKINFHLATLSEEIAQKNTFFKKCFYLLDNHHKQKQYSLLTVDKAKQLQQNRIYREAYLYRYDKYEMYRTLFSTLFNIGFSTQKSHEIELKIFLQLAALNNDNLFD